MKFPDWLEVYGDKGFRGECPKEDAELTTFFNQLRATMPETSSLVFHVSNEGKRTYRQAKFASMKGMVPGMADIVCVGARAGLIEMKRLDHTKSTWQKNQLQVLKDAKEAGAFVCVALGWESAMDAVKEWRKCLGGIRYEN